MLPAVISGAENARSILRNFGSTRNIKPCWPHEAAQNPVQLNLKKKGGSASVELLYKLSGRPLWENAGCS